MLFDKKQQLLDGIEALYPADSNHDKIAFIGNVLLRYALDNSTFNWRELPVDILERYLSICENYEIQLEKNLKVENKQLTKQLKR